MGTHTQSIETKWEVICSTSGVREGAAVPWGDQCREGSLLPGSLANQR